MVLAVVVIAFVKVAVVIVKGVQKLSLSCVVKVVVMVGMVVVTVVVVIFGVVDGGGGGGQENHPQQITTLQPFIPPKYCHQAYTKLSFS